MGACRAYANALRCHPPHLRITDLRISGSDHTGYLTTDHARSAAQLLASTLLNGSDRYPHVTRLLVPPMSGLPLAGSILSLIPRSNVRDLYLDFDSWNDEIQANVEESLLRSTRVSQVHIGFFSLHDTPALGIVDFVCRSAVGNKIQDFEAIFYEDAPNDLSGCISSLSDPRATHRLRSIHLMIGKDEFYTLPWPEEASPMRLLTIPSLEGLRLRITANVLPVLVTGTVIEDSLRWRAQSGAPPLREFRLCAHPGESEADETAILGDIRSLMGELSPSTDIVGKFTNALRTL